MSLEILFSLAGIVNIILYIIHKIAYRDSRYKFRHSWAFATIGFGIGLVFTHIPALIYGVSKDFSGLWPTMIISGGGVIMLFLNRGTKSDDVKQ